MRDGPAVEPPSEPDPAAHAANGIRVGDPADYVVLFLDFMGQKAHLRRWEQLSAECAGTFDNGGKWQPNDPRGLAEAIGKSAGVVATLFCSARDRLLGELVYRQLNTAPDFQLKGVQFSDIVVLYGKMDPRAHVGPRGLFLIHSAFLAASAVMFSALAMEAPARGAITIGQAVEGASPVSPSASNAGAGSPSGQRASESFFYGPVLGRAYELESRLADYPRILVDWGVVDYLNNLQLVSPGFREEDFDANYRDTLEKAAALVRGGVDDDESVALGGFRVLDWAGRSACSMQTSADDRKFFAKQLAEALESAERIQREATGRHAQTGDQEQLRVAGKYARLVRYLHPRVVLWADRGASGRT